MQTGWPAKSTELLPANHDTGRNILITWIVTKFYRRKCRRIL